MNKKGNRLNTTRMMNLSVLFIVLVILFTCSPFASAQSQDGYHPQGIFFNLMFVLNVSWGNETFEPILPGETREVNLTVAYAVTRGAFGRLLLQLLEGRPFTIQQSIEKKSDWCEAWITPQNLTGVVLSDDVGYANSSLFIHVNDDAPGNYTLGIVKIRATAKSMKGPFKLITLIQGYENTFTISFVTGP